MRHMLSARQQKMAEEPPPDQSAPPAGGFGKVLSSLQGLQQRLDDFSVEEVSQAHAQALELIQQLGALQARLETLKEFKHALANASTAIVSLPEADFDLIDTASDGLQNHPQLRAIVQAGKLIQMHRSIRAAEDRAGAVVLKPTGQPQHNDGVTATPVMAAGATSVITLPEIQTQTNEPAESIRDAKRAAEEPSNTVGFTLVHRSGGTLQLGSDSDLTNPELDTSPAKEPDTPSAQNQPTIESKNSIDNAVFDERLLKDLIDAYGEFAVTDTNTATRAAPMEKAPAPENLRQFIDKREIAPAPELVTSHAVFAVEPARNTPAVPEPAFLQQIAADQRALPAPDEFTAMAFDQPAPNAKTRGEIDRQLKSIIKDYGEVDLYSQRNAVNTKTKAIAAAAILALLLGGVYFFQAPSSTRPAPREAAAIAEPSQSAVGAAKNSPQQK